MVSEAIKELAARFGEYEHTGMQLAPEAVTAQVEILRALAIEVRLLEDRLEAVGALPPPVFAPANVIPFPRRPS